MASDSARTLVLPLTVLVSVAVGVFIGNSLSKRADSSTNARAETMPADDLAAAMRALTEELARTRRDAHALTSAPVVTQRTESTPTQNDAGARELREATQQLVAALELMRNSATRIGGDGALVEPAFTPDPALLDSFNPGQNSVPDETAPYLMWTYQQVVDRFGKPKRVFGGESGFDWYYVSPSGNNVRFGFQQGRLCVIQSSKSSK